MLASLYIKLICRQIITGKRVPETQDTFFITKWTQLRYYSYFCSCIDIIKSFHDTCGHCSGTTGPFVKGERFSQSMSP